MAKVLSRSGLKVGVESVAGTYQEPTQVVKLEEVTVPEVEFDVVEIPNMGFYGGAKDTVTLADWGRANVTVKTSLYKDLSFYENLFAIANLAKTEMKEDSTDANKVTSYKFTPKTHQDTTGSLDLILPDRKFKIKGAKSTFKMSGKVGEKIDTEFEIQGAYESRELAKQTITDAAASEALLIRRLGGMTLNGVALNLSEFSFEMGNEINMAKFTNIGEFYMSDYAPKITLKCRLEENSDDGFDEFKSGGAVKFEAIFRDSAGKDIWKLTIPRAKLTESPKFEDSDGIFVIERTFLAVADKGDDNFSLEYLAVADDAADTAQG